MTITWESHDCLQSLVMGTDCDWTIRTCYAMLWYCIAVIHNTRRVVPLLVAPLLVSPLLVVPLLVAPLLVAPLLVAPLLVAPLLVAPLLVALLLVAPLLVAPLLVASLLVASLLVASLLVAPLLVVLHCLFRSVDTWCPLLPPYSFPLLPLSIHLTLLVHLIHIPPLHSLRLTYTPSTSPPLPPPHPHTLHLIPSPPTFPPLVSPHPAPPPLSPDSPLVVITTWHR